MKQYYVISAFLLASTGITGGVFWSAQAPSGNTWITNTSAVEMVPGFTTTVQFHRSGSDLTAELQNFPAFRSQFKQPAIFKNQDGTITVSLESLSSGFVGTKTEQLTHIAMRLPSNEIPPKTQVFFRSLDYEQVFVTGTAP